MGARIKWTAEQDRELLLYRAKGTPTPFPEIAILMKIREKSVYRRYRLLIGDPMASGEHDANTETYHVIPKPGLLDQAKMNLGNRWRYDKYNGYLVRDAGSNNWMPVTVQELIEMGAESAPRDQPRRPCNRF